MRRTILAPVLVTLGIATAGWAGDEPKPPLTVVAVPTRRMLEESRRVIGELKQRLAAALTEALQRSPATAIAVCRTEAPAIAKAVAPAGVTVGRATRKPRNPANLATGWQAVALDHFEERAARGAGLEGASRSTTLPDGRIGYAEPLMVQPLCLTCHGRANDLAPAIRDALAVRYPADQATGYAVGDLRGVAWVELPAPLR